MNLKATLNFYGAYMLFTREIKRFLKVYHQTIISPVISSLIFLSIFYLSIGKVKPYIHGIYFLNFMGYGIIMMVMIQNSFANSSSSILMAKVIGYITDILMPPFNGVELFFAFVFGSIVRGLMVGSLLTLVLMFIIEFNFYSPFLLLYYAISACYLMAALGILSGIITNSFDQSSAITNYVIMPLSFLSGTFYSVDRLPVILQKINLFNPLFSAW